MSSLTDEAEVFVLPAGTHDFFFTCNLPPDLPSSISGYYGHIKYTACVMLHIPFWPNKKFEQKFHVFKPVNLNDFPELQVHHQWVRMFYLEREYLFLHHKWILLISDQK